jgi:hypothetical protein
MVKIRTIEVFSKEIRVILNKEKDNDYISLTDMVKGSEGEDHIRNWMRNKNTIEFLGIWEQLHNPNFKGAEFDTFWHEAGLNRFNMTPKKWIEGTNAIGIVSKSGRGGGTYAHKDIAFNFGMWISPKFQLYIVQEYQRLKKQEDNPLLEQWNVKRLLSKTNYTLHTDAIKNIIIPKYSLTRFKESLIYATEADMLNLILFGCTAKDWEEANPELAKKKMNVRDTATINQLVVLSNMESLNSMLIKQGFNRDRRRVILHQMAKDQMAVLDAKNQEIRFRKLLPNNPNKIE